MTSLEVTADPTSLGFDQARLRRIDDHFARYVDDGRLAGWQVAVMRDGQVAHHATYGSRDLERNEPWSADTIARMYSMTQPITSVGAMMLHEDGRFLYPGTGADTERGKGPGLGLKLNIPMQPASGDPQFMAAWERVEAHLQEHKPEFIVFQAGADSIAGDPLAHLQYTPAAHAHAAQRLCVLANEMCGGRIMGFGGGGYNRNNLALGWCGVLNAFIRGSEK